MRKGLIFKSIILAVCLAFFVVLPPALGDLFGKESPAPAISGAEPFGSNVHPRPTLDMVALQLPR